jgi:hypothetical protein
MNGPDFVPAATASRLTAGAFVVTGLLACAFGPTGNTSTAPADYALSVAAEARLAATPTKVATCLRRDGNTVSYPQGVSPSFTSTEADGEGLHVTQWFFLRRGAAWTTRYVLRPTGDAATEVRVLLPLELTAAQGYQRAARELLAHCQLKADNR